MLVALLLLPTAFSLHSAPLYRRAALRSLAPHASPRFRARARALVDGWARAQLSAASAPWTVSPISFGADPTGRTDSSGAFDAALAALLARGTSGHHDESGTVDLGGALLDLEGGDFLLSRPLAFPSNFSNFGMARGTLRAAPTFPPGAFLVEVGTAGAPCTNWGDSCTEDVSLEDLFLDGGQVANGVRFNAVIGVNAGPDLFVVNFTQSGVVMEGGHEVLLHESWVAACWYTPPERCWLNATALGSTTGVLINGNDHYLNQVVVFGGLNGVVVNGAANLLSGVHTWNTQIGAVPNSTGILVTQWQNRLETPYLDFVPLVLEGAAVTTVTGGFFLGGAQIVFKPHPSGYPVRGVFISANQFFASGATPDVVALPGAVPYSSIEDVTIAGSVSDDPATPRRGVTATITLRNTTSWVADFSARLVWDAANAATPLQAVTYSLWGCDGSFASTYAKVEGAVVTIVSNNPANPQCSVTITVDQSKRAGA
jgi:hypothetical protein